MKKVLLTLVVLAMVTSAALAEDPKETTIIGVGVTMNKIAADLGDVVHSGIGFSIANNPADTGFMGMTTIAIPLYIIADGTMLDSTGLITDTILGFGKRNEFVIFKSKPDARGIVSVGAGLHVNFLSVFDPTGLLYFLNAGPGLMLITGNTGGRFRASIGFHYDFLNYAYGNVFGEDIDIDVTGNIGASVQMGIAL